MEHLNSYKEQMKITNFKIIEVIQEKEDLKQKIANKSFIVSDIIEKQKQFPKLIKEYDNLRDKYQNIKKELKCITLDNESAETRLQKLREDYVLFEYKLKDSEKENERLKKQLKHIEEVIKEKQLLSNDLKNQNLYQNLRLVKINNKLNNLKGVLKKKCDESFKKKQETLNVQTDCLNFQNIFTELNHHADIELKLIDENKKLKIQNAVITNTNFEIKQALLGYKLQSKMLFEKIAKSNAKLQLLTFNMKKKENISEQHNKEPYKSLSSELDEKKSQNIKLAEMYEMSTKKINEIKNHNDELTKTIDELHSEIDILTEETKKEKKENFERICNINGEKDKLESTLFLKNEMIKNLIVEISNFGTYTHFRLMLCSKQESV